MLDNGGCRDDGAADRSGVRAVFWRHWTLYPPAVVLVWPVATYGCESWTLKMNEEMRLDAFEMKGLRKTLWVSWTAKKTNEWVLNKAGIKRELSDIVEERKLAYYGHTMRKQGSCLEKDNARNNARCT